MSISPARAAEPDDQFDATERPVRSIVLCAVPGAGEDAVADLLRSNGAGIPRAYFDTEAVARPLLARWEIANLDEYITALHRHCTTANGVFGLVLHWHELRRLHRQVAGPRQSTPGRLLEIVQAIAPEPTFVRLQRTDRAPHVRALHGWLQRPRSPQRPGGGVSTPSPAEADRIGALLDATDAAWAQWFEAIGVRPIEVVYEQVVGDPAVQRGLITDLELPAATLARATG